MRLYAASYFLVASVLYPGESVWEEHARVPVIPSTQAECDRQLRIAGNEADAAPLQVMFQCVDVNAPVTDQGATGVAGWSLEKTLPDGKETQKAKAKRNATAPKAVLINP